MFRCKAAEVLRNEAYEISGPRSEVRGKREREVLILFFLMPHALRLDPFMAIAVTKYEGNPDSIGTDRRLRTAS